MNITNNLRIRKYDDRNVVIEEYVTNVNPKTRKETSHWKLKGFYSNARNALQAIIDKDMLSDVEEVKTLTAYQKAIKNERQQLKDIIEREPLLERIMDLELENERLRKEHANEPQTKSRNAQTSQQRESSRLLPVGQDGSDRHHRSVRAALSSRKRG